MSGLIRQLALVSESSRISKGDLMKVAAALQKQAVRDLGPIWEISATVDAFDKLEDVPLGYWPIIIKDDIGEDAEGVHHDKDNQPFALVTARDKLNDWALTASHEAIEMLVDAFGNRLIAGNSPAQGQGRVNFLVEACDPSEASEFGYSVNEILVSDFYTPRYFDPERASGVRYSFTGSITEPRQVLRGGYLSWGDPVSGHWFQLIWFDAGGPRIRDIGLLDIKSESLRAQVDRISASETRKVLQTGSVSSVLQARLTSKTVGQSSSSRAERLRDEIGRVTGQRSSRAPAPQPAEYDHPERWQPKQYPISSGN
jgi:hypothetical protein